MNFESGFVRESLEPEEKQLGQRRRLIIIAAAVVVALIALFLLMHNGAEESTVIGNEDSIPRVTVVEPGRSEVSVAIKATGTLAARREMPVGVVGDGGQVAAVLVEPGDWVVAGQVLARVERSVQSQQAASLAASVQVARADARLAQNDLERAQALVSRGFISKADLDRKTATRDAANARVGVAVAQLREQHARIGHLDIRAPAAGLVLTRAVEPGQVVSPSSGVLFRLAKGGEMELLAKLSEADLARVPVGARVSVTPVGSEKSYTGEIWQIAPVVDPQSRLGIARIVLRYDRDLRPGGFATASIVSGAAQVPVLPESALQSDDRGSYVYIVNRKNAIERRAVKVGQVSLAGVAIIEGLNGSEKVVTLAGGFMTPGQKVEMQIERPAQNGKRG